jgi:hypothetical protein
VCSAACAAASLVVWSVAGMAALCFGISVVLVWFVLLRLSECASQLRLVCGYGCVWVYWGLGWAG